MAAVHPTLQDAVVPDSGALYRLLADTIPLMVWTAAADGSVDFVNRRVLDYTGMEARALEGWGWETIVHPDDREHCRAAWRQALAAGERSENEMRLRRADGEYRWHHGSGVPMRGRDGRVARWFGVATDVEDGLRKLRATEARLRALIDTEPECVKLLDAQGRLLEMNAAGLRMIEADSAEAVLGQCIYGLVAPEHATAFRSLTERVCRGERGSLEFELVGLKGTRRWMETHAVPFRDDASGETRLLAITRDITERRRAERALRESEQRFQAFMDHLPANAWIRDAQFRYTFVNRSYAQTWGDGDPHALLGRSATETFAPPIAAYFRDSDERVRAQGASVQYVDREPSGRWLKVKFPVPDGQGGLGVAGIGVDITERSRLEEALAESERRFRSFMNHAPAVAWIKDSSLRYTYVNRGYEEHYGTPAAGVLGRDDFELHQPSLATFFREEDEQIVGSGQVAQRTRDLHGAHPGRWLVTKFPLDDSAGRRGVAGIAVDVTDRSRLEEALRASEHRFRSFMQNAPTVAWLKDASFRYSFVNDAWERVFGHRADEMIGRDDFELFAPELAQYFRADDEAVLNAGQPAQKLRHFSLGESAPRHWLIVKFPLADGNGATGIAGMGIDITSQVEAEEKARRYAEEVRSLVNRLVQTQEAERRRVADELHDLIGQNLTALGIDLQALKQQLAVDGNTIAGPRLDTMASLLETTIDSIRGVMTELRPAALEEFGLLPALRWYASAFSQRTGIKVETQAAGRVLRLSRDAELALFRIVQEALTNAAKHSGGGNVKIAIRYADWLHLSVEDDGRGFAEAALARGAKRGGFGLTTMRERAEAFGGRLRVEPLARGTRVVVEIPREGNAD